MCHDYLCFTTWLIMSFSKMWLRWKSAHSAAASSQTENESKAALHFDLKEDREEEDQRNRMARQHYYKHLMVRWYNVKKKEKKPDCINAHV